MMELLRKTEIEMWIDETEYQSGNDLLDPPVRDLLDLIRSFGRDIIKRGVDVFDEQKLKTIASSSRTPNRIRRIA